MVLEQDEVRFPVGGSRPEDIVVIWQEGEQNAEKEADSFVVLARVIQEGKHLRKLART